MTRRAPLVLVALAIALVAGWLAPVAGIGQVTAARAAATDLTLATDTVYTVQPDAHRVRVTMTVTARNRTRETRRAGSGSTTRSSPSCPRPATRRSAGRPAAGCGSRAARRTPRCSGSTSAAACTAASSALQGHLRPRRQGDARRSRVRVGPSLVTLPVWAHASNGAKGGTVTVRVPAGYDVAVENGRFAKTDDRRRRDRARTGALAKPLDFFAFVSAQQPAEYAETPLAVQAGGETIDLRLNAWTDDGAWATRVGDLFTRSLPVLHDEIGLPWPHETPLTVEEAATGAQRVRGAVRSRREPDRGRLLGRSRRRDPRGGARLVQRRAARGPLGRTRGSRRSTRSGRPRRSRRTRRTRSSRTRSRRPRSRSTPGRPPRPPPRAPRARGRPRRPPRRTATRPRSRSPRRSRSAPATTRCKAVWARAGPDRGVPARRRGGHGGDRSRSRSCSTRRPTGARSSTSSRTRPARTSPTCGGSG